ncbi:hypothetical protein FC83_GL002885 [Agrilactobacillus composti DSM 18527 = JCM 14202]|uniref:VOC domain-containing protein n=1 Tax=Agrilactobacillus composti DSM 18527 = JCM 14202 TaxID=1423734 RepID=X0PFW6_9LACO|nr:VOC family protein [Agrilactobacillus composti]KRM33318.1 hypothetical protein FC83_GL002885 [Agrilactobacillus composti DSM 18527 = JCM 14202]GAF40708.1 hypothetical protein JCM14202_2614 [Agrilactobacillus composti DSM 18527 = JCM 14202]
MPDLNWDHSMINVQDLDQAIALFQDHGVIFKRGGQHEAWGTANALGYFGINYIELISVFDLAKAAAVTRNQAASLYDATQDYEAKRQRFNTVAIRSSDLQATWASLKASGVPVGPISEGQRTDAQDHLITWQIFFIDADFEGLPYPFFINWQSTDADRIAQLTQQGLIEPHPAGDLKVIQGTFEVVHPKAAAEFWAKLVGSTATAQGVDYVVPIHERQFKFTQGVANHLTTLQFAGATGELAGQTIQLGDAKLTF